MFNRVCIQIETSVKKIYFDSGLQDLFKVLPGTHDKIILALVQQTLRYDVLSSTAVPLSKNNPVKKLRFAVFAFIINLAALIFSVVKYCLISILYRLIVGRYFWDIESENNLRFVIINSAGGIDRLRSIVKDDFPIHQYKVFYLFTSFPRKIFERLKKQPDIDFIAPRLPHREAVRGCLVFLLKNGHNFTLQLLRAFNQYPWAMRLQIIAAVVRYLYALLIYQSWAVENAGKLATAFPNALFIFDLDEAGKELMLADGLNQLGKKSLLIQHGALTNARRYLPTCTSMTCTSEREKQALISESVDSGRLFVAGQALQTIKDAIGYKQSNNPAYPILILAGAGPTWLQRHYINMLDCSEYLKNNRQTFIRFHPAMGSKIKRKWIFDRNIRPTAADETLGACIANSHTVITFSIDALIVAVRQQHPSIVCIPEVIFVPAWHHFLQNIPMVKVAKSSCMLNVIMADKNFTNCSMDDFSESQWEYVDYAFGELNTKINLRNIIHKLSVEIER